MYGFYHFFMNTAENVQKISFFCSKCGRTTKNGKKVDTFDKKMKYVPKSNFTVHHFCPTDKKKFSYVSALWQNELYVVLNTYQ